MSIAEHIAAHVTARALDTAPVAIVLPPKDDIDEAGDYLGDAEGQSFLIEYEDGAGDLSRRRISVYGLRANAYGVPMLVAKCHERRATRTFRVDRIQCCIDYDGEIHDDVPRYMADTFGMPVTHASRSGAEAESNWASIRKYIQADAVILAAVSRADYLVHSSETDEATDYLSRLAEQRGAFLTEAEVRSIWRYVAKLRPNEESIHRALERIGARDPEQIKQTLMAACRVMDADGHRHPREREFLNELSREWLGLSLF